MMSKSPRAVQATARQTSAGQPREPDPLQVEVGEGRERRRDKDYEDDAHRAASSAATRSKRPSYSAPPDDRAGESGIAHRPDVVEAGRRRRSR